MSNLRCDDCRGYYSPPIYYSFDAANCTTDGQPHVDCTGNLCTFCAGPDLVPDRPEDGRRLIPTDAFSPSVERRTLTRHAPPPAEGPLPEGEIDVTTPYGRAEAQPYRGHGIIEGYDVYHPNGVHVGYIRIDDEDDFSYETRGGDGDYLEGETPLSRVQRGVLLLVEHEGEAPFSGSLDYRCSAAHQACAHISDGPCHRDVAVANSCPAGDCDGPTDDSSDDE